MSITAICNEIAKKIGAVKQKGYEEGFAAGKESGGGGGGGDMDAFWESYQANGTRNNYAYAFSYSGWNDDTFYPKYDMKAGGYWGGIFTYSKITNIRKRLEDCGVSIDTSKGTTLENFYAYASDLVEAPLLDLEKCTSAKNLCRDCSKLIKAPLKNISAVSQWATAFDGCTALTDIGQESDAFGCFSSSVDLSQTAINFGTPKMSLCNLSRDWRQENSYLKFYYGDNAPTLKISRQQYDAAQAYLDLDYSSEDGGPYFELNLVGGCGWMLAVD